MEKSLEYIQLGREMFEFNLDLIITELNYYLANDDFSKAENLLNLAIEEDPNNHQLYFVLGNSYDNLNQFDKAVSAYKEAILIKPDFFDALYNLGTIYYNKGAVMLKEANNMIGKNQMHLQKRSETMFEAFHILNLVMSYMLMLKILKEVFIRNGDAEKYQEISSKLNKIK